jgi:hypothetical protein
MDNTPLNDVDETASQGSARSTGRSLLERIQAQREREAAAAAAAAAAESSNTFVPNQPQQQSTPQQINIPNYGESMATNAMGNSSMMTASLTTTENSNFFSSAWNNITSSMENGMAYHQQQHQEPEIISGDGMEDALLPPSGAHRYGAGTSAENYSMAGYFTTFVNDVYGLFLRLPVPARIVTVVLLLYIAMKLL